MLGGVHTSDIYVGGVLARGSGASGRERAGQSEKISLFVDFQKKPVAKTRHVPVHGAVATPFSTWRCRVATEMSIGVCWGDRVSLTLCFDIGFACVDTPYEGSKKWVLAPKIRSWRSLLSVAFYGVPGANGVAIRGVGSVGLCVS